MIDFNILADLWSRNGFVDGWKVSCDVVSVRIPSTVGCATTATTATNATAANGNRVTLAQCGNAVTRGISRWWKKSPSQLFFYELKQIINQLLVYAAVKSIDRTRIDQSETSFPSTALRSASHVTASLVVSTPTWCILYFSTNLDHSSMCHCVYTKLR